MERTIIQGVRAKVRQKKNIFKFNLRNKTTQLMMTYIKRFSFDPNLALKTPNKGTYAHFWPHPDCKKS